MEVWGQTMKQIHLKTNHNFLRWRWGLVKLSYQIDPKCLQQIAEEF